LGKEGGRFCQYNQRARTETGGRRRGRKGSQPKNMTTGVNRFLPSKQMRGVNRQQKRKEEKVRAGPNKGFGMEGVGKQID